MSARLLLEVALRVMGLWYFFASMVTLTNTAWNAWIAIENPTSPNFTLIYAVSTGLSTIVQLALAAALIKWAPHIAARF
jgi:hypothetical protein